MSVDLIDHKADLSKERALQRDGLEFISDSLFDWARENSRGKLEHEQRVCFSDVTITINTDLFNVSLSDQQIQFLNKEDMASLCRSPFAKIGLIKGMLPIIDGRLIVKKIPDGGTRFQLDIDMRSPIERIREKIPPFYTDKEFLAFAGIHFSFILGIFVLLVTFAIAK